MPEELIISISGLRGLAGQNLTESVAVEYARAFGSFLKNSFPQKQARLSVCLGRDSRPSGQMLSKAVSDGLISAGIDVIDIGIISTPGVGVMLRHLGCCGGVVVTASHNPVQYNGIKLLLDNGIAPPPKSAEKIKQIYLNKSFETVSQDKFGKVTFNKDAADIHVDKVLSIVDVDTKAKKYKVVLDPVNGAGGQEAKMLLAKLGCKVLAMNFEPTGLFAHTPEPLAENLTGLCDEVKKQKADIGFALDPDADRLAIVDENGRYIGEEYTLALAAKFVLSNTKGPVATNLSTSRMVDDIARKAGVSVFRTAVGEANVANAMIENSCVIGGEGNGGVIDLRVGPIRDSLVGMALVLQLMAQTGKTISTLVKEIPSYFMVKDKFKVETSKVSHLMDEAKKVFADARLNTIDGCRFDFEDGWLHLRPSNTEPVVRLIVEAKDPHIAHNFLQTILKIRQSA